MFVVENLTRRRLLATRIRSASNSSERRRGLLDVNDLDESTGLWINPCEAIHTFGMKMSLDLVFLDAQFRVRKVVPEIKPNRVSVCLSAKSVLEIKAGAAARSGTERGDQLRLRVNGGPEALPTASAGADR